MDSLSDEDPVSPAAPSWEPHYNVAGIVEISVNFFHENGRYVLDCVGLERYIDLFSKKLLKWQQKDWERPEHNPTPEMITAYVRAREALSLQEEQRRRAEEQAEWEEQARIRALKIRIQPTVLPARTPAPPPEVAVPRRVYAALAPASVPVHHRPIPVVGQRGRQRMDRSAKLKILRDLAAKLKAERARVNVGILARVATNRGGPLEGKTQETSLNTFLYTLNPEEKTFVGL